MKKMIPFFSFLALLIGCATVSTPPNEEVSAFMQKRDALIAQAEVGDSVAQMKLSSSYANGLGQKGNRFVDLPKSVEWLKKSVDQDNLVALAELSVRSNFGSFGVKKNTNDARTYAGRALDVYNREPKPSYSVRELFVLNLALTGAGDAEFKAGDKDVAARYLCTAAKIDPSNQQTHKILVNTGLTCS